MFAISRISVHLRVRSNGPPHDLATWEAIYQSTDTIFRHFTISEIKGLYLAKCRKGLQGIVVVMTQLRMVVSRRLGIWMLGSGRWLSEGWRIRGAEDSFAKVKPARTIIGFEQLVELRVTVGVALAA